MAYSPALGHRPHSWATFNPPFDSMHGVYGLHNGPSVSLNRHRVDSSNQSGLEGARQLIDTIKKRRRVTVLNLPHNDLGPEGCEALFAFLTSADGKKHLVEELILTSNKLGNSGLRHLLIYLRHNVNLKKLMLQNNDLQPDVALFEELADAVNGSALETLYIGTNSGLSDLFVQTFLPRLNAPCLRELNISSSRISAQSLPDIIDFLCSPNRCRLHTFGCSANTLGTAGVGQIIAATEKVNYRLKKLDLFSNQTNDEAVDTVENRDAWRQTYHQLTRYLARNARLTRETETQALRLLRYARPILLHHTISTPVQASNPNACDDCSCSLSQPSRTTSLSSLPLNPASSPSLLPVLPVELKQHVLTFFAPSLSSSQRIRIFHYAASPSTLPLLLPCLTKASASSAGRTTCLPDPTGFGIGAVTGSCPPGHCMGSHNSLSCPRAEDRSSWLELVGCDAYDASEISPPE